MLLQLPLAGAVRREAEGRALVCSPQQNTQSSFSRTGAPQRLHVREARPLKDPDQRCRRGHRPLRPKKSCRAPNRRAQPNQSSKQNSRACSMLLSPLGGACNPRLPSSFKHNRYQKNKNNNNKKTPHTQKKQKTTQVLQWPQ